MNKKMILTLVMIANLHGQIVSANEVAISETRLQTISAQELAMLQSNGAARVANGQVVLNLQKLEVMLKNPIQQKQLAVQAKKMSTNFVPYGNTIEVMAKPSIELVEALSSRFVPYGNT